MTPDHKTETLEGLIARLRKLATDSRDEAGRIRSTVFVATEAEANCFIRAEVWDGVADELAPILAGLRELREQMQGNANYPMESYDAGLVVAAESVNNFIEVLDVLLGQPATADQTGAGKGEKC